MNWRPALSLTLALVCGCKARSSDASSQPQAEPPPAPVASEPPVPQAMPLDELDASLEPVEGMTPLEQARIYESRGQLWMAQMVLEKSALGAKGTKPELELLGTICQRRDDGECVARCEAKLGRRLPPRSPRSHDAGAMVNAAGREHHEPESDLALHEEWSAARAVLQPKLLSGKASKEEMRLLKKVCQHEGDRLCVALCDAKLK